MSEPKPAMLGEGSLAEGLGLGLLGPGCDPPPLCFQDLCPALGGLPSLLRQAGALPPGADAEASGSHQGCAPPRGGTAQGAQKGGCRRAGGWGTAVAARIPGLLGPWNSSSWCVPLRALLIPRHQTQNPTDLSIVEFQTLKILTAGGLQTKPAGDG